MMYYFKTENEYLVFDENEMLAYSVEIINNKIIITREPLKQVILTKQLLGDGKTLLASITFITETHSYEFMLSNELYNRPEYREVIGKLLDLVRSTDFLLKGVKENGDR